MDFADLVALAGLLLLGGGAAMIFMPAGLMLIGAILLVGAVLHERGAKARRS